MSDARAVELLTRVECPLCDRAQSMLERWAGLLGLAVDITDVDADPALTAEFGSRVPVIRAADGHVLAEGRIDAGQLLWSLARHRWER